MELAFEYMFGTFVQTWSINVLYFVGLISICICKICWFMKIWKYFELWGWCIAFRGCNIATLKSPIAINGQNVGDLCMSLCNGF